MHVVQAIVALESLYGQPGEASLIKVTDHLTPEDRQWIAVSRFCVLSTVGPEGTDGSPRGDDRPVVEGAKRVRDCPRSATCSERVKAGFDRAASDADWPGRAARTVWAEG